MNFKFKSCRLTLRHQLALSSDEFFWRETSFWMFVCNYLLEELCVNARLTSDKEEVFPFLMWNSKQKYKRKLKSNYWCQKRTKKLMKLSKKAKYFLKKIKMHYQNGFKLLCPQKNISVFNLQHFFVCLLVGGNEAKSNDLEPLTPRLGHLLDCSLLIS